MIKFIFGGLLGALVVLFVVQNPEIVTVKLFSMSLSLSRAVIILSVLVIGIFIGWLISGMRKKNKKV